MSTLQRRRLLIDLGNSRLKWALSDDAHGRASVAGGGKPGATPPAWQSGALLHRDQPLAPLLAQALGAQSDISEVWACAVASTDKREALANWCVDRWSVAPRFVVPASSACGVRNGYTNPAQLGADRWAALVGAREIAPGGCVIVDCGTAITIDALSASGEFIGGVILPGLALQRGALLQGTAGLGEPPGAALVCQARSTAEAIGAGTLIGTAGAIERIVAEHRAALGESTQALLTGGDATIIAPHLRFAFTAVPELVLRGLERLATC